MLANPKGTVRIPGSDTPPLEPPARAGASPYDDLGSFTDCGHRGENRVKSG
jgi:hypothetical protein